MKKIILEKSKIDLREKLKEVSISWSICICHLPKATGIINQFAAQVNPTAYSCWKWNKKNCARMNLPETDKLLLVSLFRFGCSFSAERKSSKA